MMVRHAVLGVVTALTAALSGCSASDSTPVPVPSAAAISEQQRAALADGTVTWDEYKAGFEAYSACLSAAGYQLDDPHVDDYELMKAGVPADAVDSGVDEKCYRFHWNDIDSMWQSAHENTSESLEIIKACLEKNGIAPVVDYGDNAALLEKHGIDITKCPSGN